MIERETLERSLAARLQRIEAPRQLCPDPEHAIEGVPTGHRIAVKTSELLRQRVERHQAVGLQRQCHRAMMGLGPSYRARAGQDHSRSCRPHRIHSEHAVVHLDQGHQRVQVDPPEVTRAKHEVHRAFRGDQRVDDARGLDTSIQACPALAPRQGLQVEAPEVQVQAVGAPAWRQDRDRARAPDLADLTLHVGVHEEPVHRAIELHLSAERSFRQDRREGATDPLEAERRERHVGRHAHGRFAAVEPQHAVDDALRPLAVLVPGAAGERRVGERTIEGAHRMEPPIQQHRRREVPHGAEVDVAPRDRHLVEHQRAGARSAAAR